MCSNEGEQLHTFIQWHRRYFLHLSAALIHNELKGDHNGKCLNITPWDKSLCQAFFFSFFFCKGWPRCQQPRRTRVHWRPLHIDIQSFIVCKKKATVQKSKENDCPTEPHRQQSLDETNSVKIKVHKLFNISFDLFICIIIAYKHNNYMIWALMWSCFSMFVSWKELLRFCSINYNAGLVYYHRKNLCRVYIYIYASSGWVRESLAL